MNNKLIKLLTLFLFSCFLTNAQDSDKKDYPLKADVATIDGIIKAYYEIISGPAGEPINFQRDKSLHYENALILFSGSHKNKIYNDIKNVFDFHKNSAKTKPGIWEYEIERDTHQYGNIVNVWSTFGIREKVGGGFKEKVISSVQLYHETQTIIEF